MYILLTMSIPLLRRRKAGSDTSRVGLLPGKPPISVNQASARTGQSKQGLKCCGRLKRKLDMTHEEAGALRPRQEIAALPPYNAGLSARIAREVSGRSDIAALASNENPYGCSPLVSSALSDLATSRYSDSASRELRGALSKRLGFPAEQIVCGNGSEELIAAVCRAFLEKGDSVLTIAPSFGLHEIEPKAAGARVIKVPMTADLDYDVPLLEQVLAKLPKLVFLSSPSNPVGKALTEEALERILSGLRPQTLLVLDEAYFEMIEPGYPDGLKVLSRFGGISWIDLRTFSKAYGLAGLRVGYGVASHSDIARAVRAALTPFNVNVAAQTAAVAALEDSAWMENVTAVLRRDRDHLASRLEQMGLRVIPSQANFLFIDLGVDAAQVAKDLLLKGIIVKPWMEPGYTNFLRVSIGKPEDNDRIAHELGTMFANK